jgi:hypothetical protein
MFETQILEDELKVVSELNLILLAEKQVLEAWLAKDSQAKDGERPIDFLSLYIYHVQVNSELIITLSCRVQEATHGTWHCSR